jgi:hypothetical protein
LSDLPGFLAAVLRGDLSDISAPFLADIVLLHPHGRRGRGSGARGSSHRRIGLTCTGRG